MMQCMERVHSPALRTRSSGSQSAQRNGPWATTNVCLSRSLRPLETCSFVRLCPRGAEGREALGAMQCFASTKRYFVIHFWKDAFRIKAMPGGAVSWWELYPTWPSESANQLHFPVSLFLPCCRNVSWSIWHKHQWPPSLVCLFSCQGAFLFLFILL